jgi:hypothetical protein
VVRWFFPERRLDGLLPRVWSAYGDETLLAELTRVTTLEAEPVIARFVTDIIAPLQPGTIFPVEMARDYVTATYGVFKENSYKRLLLSTRTLGFLARRGAEWTVNGIARPGNALLILIHERLASAPRIVRVADILQQPFWRYLGLRDAEELRAVLRDASAEGLIARYSVVDQLEQITTLYSVDAYLQQALRLSR